MRRILPRRHAEMPVKAPAYMPAFNWTGFYAGINGGGAWGRSNWSASGNSFDTSGGVVGGTIGYNWQAGPTVFGVEGDIDWSGIKGSTTCGGFSCETKNDWLGTFRGRVGYAFNRVMPYVTGGLAVGNIKATSPLRQQRRDACGLDARRRYRSQHRRPVERQDRVPLRRSRQDELLDLRRRRHGDRRQLPHQHRARGLQLPLLIARITDSIKPRNFVPGLFVCANESSKVANGTKTVAPRQHHDYFVTRRGTREPERSSFSIGGRRTPRPSGLYWK